MKHSRRSARYLATAWLVLTASWASAFDIFQLPMSATGAATPNVMLLVDNSGSMNNIIWADGFDVATTYTGGFDSNEGNYHITSIDGSNGCTGGGRWVRSDGKDLCLPNPAGGTGTLTDTRYTGNYLNYLFSTYTDNTVLTDGTIPNETRMQVARDVAKQLLDDVTGVRFGLTTFNGDCNDSANGGRVLRACDDRSDTQIANLKSSIDGLDAENNTPLAEALYEITRYFRGLRSNYHCSGSGTVFTSPLQYRCQKNFTIAITDGFPTRDTTFPGDDPDDVADARNLPNWDGQAPTTAQSDYPLFPQYSDGFQPESGFGQADEGWSLYLDDIAKFGFDIDMKTSGNDSDTPPQSWGSMSDAAPEPGEPDFRKQNMTTYTVGFATANQMLQDAADYSGGQYFTASNAAQLKAALEEVLLDIQTKATSAASVSLNSTRLDTGSLIYQATFDSTDWSGNLKAIGLDVNSGAVGAELWGARDLIPAPADRKIFTTKSDTRAGLTFTWSNLSAAQKNALKGTSNTNSTNTTNGTNRLNYLRGTRTQEQQNGGVLRNRSYVLGDIVNSDPLFVGTPNFGYHVLSGAEGTDYTTFRATSAYVNRPPVVYVGANEGMLHAFNANKTGAGAGSELFAYVPLPAYQYMRKITEPAYSHRFFVDGPPVAGDAYIGGAWKTILVGTLGAGGRGVFALDVTSPATFGASNVLWEKVNINDPTSVSNWTPRMNIVDTGFTDLGFTYGQASIGRMANGQWAAIVGNGYNSDGNKAVLFILDLETGAIIKKIDTGVGDGTNQNGLSTPVIVDVNNDKIVDYIYAGDMRGNMWKFDVTDATATNWNVAYLPSGVKTPLYTAQAPDGTVQPITAKPQVTRRPDGDLMVLFGTGKYFEEVDRRVVATPTPQVQTFYAVRDPGVTIGSGRSTLQQQSVIDTVTAYSRTLRVTTNVKPTATQNGWYMDLPTAGERQVSAAVLRTGRIIFTTVIPNSDACSAGGTSWLMEVNALTGSRLEFSPYDLNNDGKFTETVTVTIDGQPVEVPVTGLGSDVGVVGTPGIAQKQDKEYKYLSGSTGGISVTIEPGDIGAGRQSWRQLQ